MDIGQLPDLSDWRFVEVWTLEEAAMLWAAIDPMAHHGKRLADMSGAVHPVQYRKALVFLRAAKEAVCAGTLPFTEAWEDHSDEYGNSWSNKIDFPDLPKPLNISADMTRVQQAAFLKWAKSKHIPSMKQSIKSAAPPQVIHTELAQESQPKPVLLLDKPSPLDQSHPCHPEELRVGFEVWEKVVSTGAHEGVKSPKTALRAELDAHPEYKQLSNEAKARISIAANWKKEGGATKTPTKASLPTPKN